MITTRGVAGRAVVSFAQQVTLSVLGTLAATVVVTTLKTEWSIRPIAPLLGRTEGAPQNLPSLTRGGKFAERALSNEEAEPFVILTRLPPVLPLFTAPAVPPLMPVEADVSDLAMPGRDASPLPTSIMRHPRPHGTAPVPPRRIDRAIAASTPIPTSPVVEPQDPSIWSRPKLGLRRVADWTDALIDILRP